MGGKSNGDGRWAVSLTAMGDGRWAKGAPPKKLFSEKT